MNAEERLKIEEKVVEMLHTVYDPEIPVDIYELGLVYKIDLDDDGNLVVDMTLTAPNCPMADFILEDVRMKLEARERRRGEKCCRKHCFRARVDAGHDERGSKT